MKVGLSTHLSVKKDPEEIVRLAEKLELDCVEIVFDIPHFFPDDEVKEIRNLNEVIRSAGLHAQVHDSFLDLNPISQYSELRKITLEQSEESVKFCDFLNGDQVTIHPGRCWLRENQDILQKCQERFENYLEELSDYAQDREITVGIETGAHPADYPSDSEELLRHVRDREGVGITLDIGHAYLRVRKDEKSGGAEIAKLIKLFGKELVNVHLHDNGGRSDDHLPPGQGEINFDPILGALDKYYDGPVILELWDPSTPEKSAGEGVEYLRKFQP
ncbi:hypothetical protein AKJ65_00525 [candidate division MSBL1 archaeon SCGC-AAA259E19]|uniref:Xylose isomerase-like TIM barrel domain-containing protein n=1 Tax=candidate division MSBL1 archaeon SCGC-AAA259E19 TaxID=1698264 RepID=A0A133UNR2_9EURY|nr:hypothetical protein AKJ65_00525 [candidate division MSBL1 archaeon SCGC-AAA259E19]